MYYLPMSIRHAKFYVFMIRNSALFCCGKQQAHSCSIIPRHLESKSTNTRVPGHMFDLYVHNVIVYKMDPFG